MTKKLIAFMIVATLAFIGVFAACNNTDKDEDADKTYLEGNEYRFVTDENGERVLDENGEFVVYYTDENGKIVEDENGEKITVIQDFQPVSEKNQVEDYGYKITLPDGWVSDIMKGSFVNGKTNDKFRIDVIEKTSYQENYQTAKMIYEEALKSDEFDCTFEELFDLNEEYEGLFRLTVKDDESISVIHTFKNNGNLYCITYDSTNTDISMDSIVELMNCITFKPYQYFEETSIVFTAPPTTTEPTTASVSE